MKYDFVLFENSRQTDNHYKDLEFLALMIKKAGFSVAIAEVFKEKEFCKNELIPHIVIKTQCPQEIRDVFKTSNKLKNIYHQIKLSRYLQRVIKELLPYSDNIYVGSLFKNLSIISCFRMFPQNKNCFVWGLRSSALKTKKGIRLSNIYGTIIKKLCVSEKNIKIVVSNELIRDEFHEIGIEESRLLVRPERVIDTLPEFKPRKSTRELHLLSIGSIRTKKKVEQCLEALALLKDNSIYYTIAGKSNSEEKEKAIEAKMNGVPNVVRINRRLDDDEYQKLIDECDFIVLCDDNFDGGISSGTMNEGILCNKPIISSNCPTFTYYVEKYGVGLIYKWEDIESLANVIKDAKAKGTEYFLNNMRDYQKLFLERNTIISFKEQLSIIL